ncbi:hypothetical protein FGADI_3447 [Fusarium gaditjirri]|uniref:Uncharacterized protein n=1 Tax=Fusarium gaditjirri TaxID=282569 RepID=A0A8H4WZX5_9HYPO|nr:hypothetical protein FGADI_3447 [Fusarium gaditjirri]
MCPITFWMHECFFCGAVKDNASRSDPEITSACPGCAEPVEVKLEWRYWICPVCEEDKATDEPKYPPRGQRQERVPVYRFPNGTRRQNEYQRQDEPQCQNEPRFQDAPQFQDSQRFQDAPRYQPLQSNPSARHTAQQFPAGQGEQRPQYYQMGYPPHRQGRRESHGHGHGHHHHY